MKRSLLILTLFLGCGSWTYCVEQTAVIAAKMDYSETITKLRNRTDNWLRDLRILMSEKIQTLRSRGRKLRAEEFTLRLKDTYFSLEKKIDNAFDQLNREFIADSKKLDLEDSSQKTKIAFILQIIQKSEQKIDELHKKESASFAQ